MMYVIGSGPSGVSCATALLDAGHEVCLLDAGKTLEPWRGKVVDQLQTLDFEAWDTHGLHSLDPEEHPGLNSIPTKLLFGSDFPYRSSLEACTEQDGVEIKSSLARGGLSNVWGAAILPYRECDIPDWPIKIGDLERHYQAVLQFMPMSARADGLKDAFPVYNGTGDSLLPSRQAEAFLRDLQARAHTLQAKGISFGQSRLAVQAGPKENHSGCIYCGQCLSGCVYGLIYNSSSTLKLLRNNPKFKYLDGLTVLHLAESADSVQISALSIESGERLSFRADKVFVACGVLESTRLLLSSLSIYEKPVSMKDTYYFLLPLLRYSGIPGVEKERLHTLAQIFLEIVDPAVSPRPVHLQVYTYNSLLAKAVQNVFGKAGRLLARPLSPLLSRLLLVQGFLHSQQSDEILVELARPDERTAVGTLRLTSRPNPQAAAVVSRGIRKLKQCRSDLRAIAFSSMLRTGKPGRGFHAGGTFPMREHPNQGETDTLGRPAGLRRIHVVDSSVFSSIPATPITYTVMANAHRIGTRALET